MSALHHQVSGDHYKSLKIQPIEYIHANGLPFAEGSILKDLEKARHFIDLLIELEQRELMRLADEVERQLTKA